MWSGARLRTLAGRMMVAASLTGWTLTLNEGTTDPPNWLANGRPAPATSSTERGRARSRCRRCIRSAQQVCRPSRAVFCSAGTSCRTLAERPVALGLDSCLAAAQWGSMVVDEDMSPTVVE